MEVEVLEKNLKDGNLSSIYFLYGEEKFILEACFNKILKNFGDRINGINYISLDLSNVGTLIDNIQTPAFGYPKKLIVVKDSGLFKKSAKLKKGEKENKVENKIANYINENIDYINETIVLVFIEDSLEKNDLYKIIEKNGIVCEFNKLKLPDLIRKIRSLCKAYEVEIDEATAKYFVEICGTSMQDIINEIRKQIEYTGKGGKINKESIDLLAIPQIESVIFDLTDNLGKKNIKVSLQILNNLKYNKEPVQKILITLYNHFKKLYLTKIAVSEGKNIVESLQLKPNQTFLSNKYLTQSKYFSEHELNQIIKSLIDLDYNYKMGKIDIELGLDSILCIYCS